MRLIDFLDRGASFYPNRTCLKDDNVSWTYEEVRQITHRYAQALHQEGIKPGDRIGVYSANGAAGFAAILAIFRAGCIWLPVNARNPLHENAEFLRKHECSALLFDRRHEGEAADAAAAVATLKKFSCLDIEMEQCAIAAGPVGQRACTLVDVDRSGDHVAIIKSTGGTTGKPKSVMITHRNMSSMIANFLALMPYPAPPVNLVAVPMTHGAGNIALALLAVGGTLVFLDRADPDRILSAIESERVTTLFLPPTVIYTLLARPDIRSHDYSSLRHLIYSAAPMSAEKLREAIEVFGPVMTQAYGQTEAPLLCTFMSPQEHMVDDHAALQRRLTSCGRQTPFTRVEILDEEGRMLGANQVGEIVVRGDLVMAGYYDNAEENEKVSRFGWHHTGDVGLRDEQGYIYIVDRKKDMIISGGFNIYPSEIEQVLWSHPGIQDCAVIGVPDPKWGETVMAIVELKPGISAQDIDLPQFCRQRLGSMKTPKKFEFWPELPRSSVGKVLKKDIRERFWAGQTRRV